MNASPRQAMWLFPRRLRTIMIVNVVVAVFMVTLIWLNGGAGGRGSLIMSTIMLLLALSVIGAIITLPMVLVQMYLYPKKHGLWYAWENRSQRGLDAGPQVPAHILYPRSAAAAALRSQWERLLSTKTVRTRLFEGGPATDSVSRAALLLTVAEQMEQAGKKEAARTCYRQIIDRFGATREAEEAAQRVDALGGEDLPGRREIGCIG
jgi:hypothetical protein